MIGVFEYLFLSCYVCVGFRDDEGGFWFGDGEGSIECLWGEGVEGFSLVVER